jgi:multidrug efflux pump subunit AcrA (membrane-fusion protein)
LQVPRSAIIEEIGQTSVFVVENDIAIRRPVETGFSNEGLIEITSGLTDDELVVTVGQIGLKPDAKVMVINADDGTELNLAEKSDIPVSDNAPTD